MRILSMECPMGQTFVQWRNAAPFLFGSFAQPSSARVAML